MSQKQIFSIGELAKEFEITTRSVRFYEDQGLLISYRRGNTRIFDDKHRARLKLILRNKRMGLALQAIKDLFDLWDRAIPGGNEEQLLKMLEILEGRRADIPQAEMEIETAETRCREALAELQKKKKQQAPANDEARQTAEHK